MNPLRTHRLAKGMTQAQLADKMGISRCYMNQIENSKRNITVTIFMDWREALHLTDEQTITVLKWIHRN